MVRSFQALAEQGPTITLTSSFLQNEMGVLAEVLLGEGHGVM